MLKTTKNTGGWDEEIIKTEKPVIPVEYNVIELKTLVLFLKTKLNNIKNFCENNAPMSQIHGESTDGLNKISEIL